MSDSSRYTLDTRALHDAVTSVARHRGISMRTVSEETGLSPSTLSRLAAGLKPDADGLLSLLAWLGYPATFGRKRDG